MNNAYYGDIFLYRYVIFLPDTKKNFIDATE